MLAPDDSRPKIRCLKPQKNSRLLTPEEYLYLLAPQQLACHDVSGHWQWSDQQQWTMANKPAEREIQTGDSMRVVRLRHSFVLWST